MLALRAVRGSGPGFAALDGVRSLRTACPCLDGQGRPGFAGRLPTDLHTNVCSGQFERTGIGLYKCALAGIGLPEARQIDQEGSPEVSPSEPIQHASWSRLQGLQGEGAASCWPSGQIVGMPSPASLFSERNSPARSGADFRFSLSRSV
jgi:hypothetical protein